MGKERLYRPEDALLAGVCAELSRRLGWNVWAIRGLFVAGLFLQTLGTAVLYGVAALAMGLILGRSGFGAEEEEDDSLQSETLEVRGKRIQDLEEKFRALEREHR